MRVFALLLLLLFGTPLLMHAEEEDDSIEPAVIESADEQAETDALNEQEDTGTDNTSNTDPQADEDEANATDKTNDDAAEADDENAEKKAAATARQAAEAYEEQGRQKLPDESVEFDGQSLPIAFHAEKDGDSIREFIPQGETLKNWTRLAAIRTFAAANDPAAMALRVRDALKKDYPNSPSRVIENEKTGETIIDFVVWPADGEFVEFNIFKYQKGEKGGVVSWQYALRAYEDTEGFLKELGPLRTRLVELMANEGLKLKSGTKPANADTADAKK